MNKQNIHVFAKWQVTAGEIDTVLDCLPELAEKSRAEAGNLYYKAYQDNTDPNIIMLNEAYADQEALNAHRNSSHYQDIVVAQIVPLLKNREVTLTHEL
ncbi:putative quinol monooxygenase [Pedobacter miscanthi]|uniref:Antibiotic biosynthesis monooxygenase n=1 Tax=Pedobacter miscanthi TaxID=2259170 RepID=A0A366KT21_9SPHI|nr:putative quinol monooxygenase [Pedobacter miscanthi]RBQ03982.1 antibiotic biosynthesis monooxygenase [Pedobacter miscanthi]